MTITGQEVYTIIMWKYRLTLRVKVSAYYRIQDEAHRFAIEYHRSLRSKGQVHSVLDDIPGIGETRRKALMRKFKSLEQIRDASLEELTHTESMNVASAEKVYEFFHGKEEMEKGKR